MRNRKVKLLIASILLVALAAPAAVLAYFTDYEEAHGGAVLKLEGETTINETPKDAKKTISIKNTGKTDVVVRVAIYGDYLGDIDCSADDWTKDGDWYYYEGVLAPNESTSDIVANIDVEAAKAAGHDFDIVVVHESERVSYTGTLKDDGTIENKVVRPDGWSSKWKLPTQPVASEEVGD